MPDHGYRCVYHLDPANNILTCTLSGKPHGDCRPIVLGMDIVRDLRTLFDLQARGQLDKKTIAHLESTHVPD